MGLPVIVVVMQVRIVAYGLCRWCLFWLRLRNGLVNWWVFGVHKSMFRYGVCGMGRRLVVLDPEAS
jgi:hypothetical protein